MLTKNEAQTLPRTLPPLLEVIDSWTLCDTGSSDDTTEVARELLAGLPGRLVERPWRSFAKNRSELFELASGDGEWLLLWDADWLPTIHPDLRRWLAENQPADVDAWSIEIRDSGV